MEVVTSNDLSGWLDTTAFEPCVRACVAELSDYLDSRLMLQLVWPLDETLYTAFQVAHIANLSISITDHIHSLKTLSRDEPIETFNQARNYSTPTGLAMELEVCKRMGSDFLPVMIAHFSGFNLRLHETLADQLLDEFQHADGESNTENF